MSRFRHFWELLWMMAEKELLVRYHRTFLGFFWLLINPLLQMLVIGYIFTFFIRQPIANYYLFLLCGLLVWIFFSSTLSKSAPSIVNERNLIKKSSFPREIIPLSVVLTNLIYLLVSFILFLVPVLILKTLSPFFPVLFLSGLVLLLIFTAGLSLLTAAVNVRFRDVSLVIQAVLIVWFYATPVVYSLSLIPRNIVWLWYLNPLSSAVQLFQSALLSSAPPELPLLTANLVLSLLIAAAGITFFRHSGPSFDDWL